MGENTKDRCFVIMPISDHKDYSEGHFTNVYEQIIKPAIEEAGYEPYRVDENKICDSIINKIFDAVQECPMAICDLSSRNPNVLYELGLRQAYDKPVVLIQDDKTEKIFDVSGIGTVFYKSNRLYENVISARNEIREAIIATKEGKQNSIVQMVNARKANISDGNLTQNDKIEIMFNSIMSALEKEKSGASYKEGSTNVFSNKDSYVLCVDKIQKLNQQIKLMLEIHPNGNVPPELIREWEHAISDLKKEIFLGNYTIDKMDSAMIKLDRVREKVERLKGNTYMSD